MTELRLWRRTRYDFLINLGANLAILGGGLVVGRLLGMKSIFAGFDPARLVVVALAWLSVALWLALAIRRKHFRYTYGARGPIFPSVLVWPALVTLVVEDRGPSYWIISLLAGASIWVVIVHHLRALARDRRLKRSRSDWLSQIAVIAERRRSGVARHRPVRSRTAGPVLEPRSLRRSRRSGTATDWSQGC